MNLKKLKTIGFAFLIFCAIVSPNVVKWYNWSASPSAWGGQGSSPDIFTGNQNNSNNWQGNQNNNYTQIPDNNQQQPDNNTPDPVEPDLDTGVIDAEIGWPHPSDGDIWVGDEPEPDAEPWEENDDTDNWPAEETTDTENTWSCPACISCPPIPQPPYNVTVINQEVQPVPITLRKAKKGTTFTKRDLYMNQFDSDIWLISGITGALSLFHFFVAFILLLRIVILWILLVLSPFLFALALLTLSKSILFTWTSVYLRWLLIWPLLAISIAVIAHIWNFSGVPLHSLADSVGLIEENVTNLSLYAPWHGAGDSPTSATNTNHEIMKLIMAVIMAYGSLIIPFALTKRSNFVAINPTNNIPRKNINIKQTSPNTPQGENDENNDNENLQPDSNFVGIFSTKKTQNIVNKLKNTFIGKGNQKTNNLNALSVNAEVKPDILAKDKSKEKTESIFANQEKLEQNKTIDELNQNKTDEKLANIPDFLKQKDKTEQPQTKQNAEFGLNQNKELPDFQAKEQEKAKPQFANNLEKSFENQKNKKEIDNLKTPFENREKENLAKNENQANNLKTPFENQEKENLAENKNQANNSERSFENLENTNLAENENQFSEKQDLETLSGKYTEEKTENAESQEAQLIAETLKENWENQTEETELAEAEKPKELGEGQFMREDLNNLFEQEREKEYINSFQESHAEVLEKSILEKETQETAPNETQSTGQKTDEKDQTEANWKKEKKKGKNKAKALTGKYTERQKKDKKEDWSDSESEDNSPNQENETNLDEAEKPKELGAGQFMHDDLNNLFEQEKEKDYAKSFPENHAEGLEKNILEKEPEEINPHKTQTFEQKKEDWSSLGLENNSEWN